MSLETLLEENTKALAANTAALLRAAGVPLNATQARAAVDGQANRPPAAAPAKATPAKPTVAPEAPAGNALDYTTAVKPKVIKFGEVKGREALIAVLGEFNAKNGKEVKPADYAALVTKLDEGLAEAAEALA